MSLCILFLFISLFVRDNAAHIITYTAITVNAITMSVDVLHKRLASKSANLQPQSLNLSPSICSLVSFCVCTYKNGWDRTQIYSLKLQAPVLDVNSLTRWRLCICLALSLVSALNGGPVVTSRDPGARRGRIICCAIGICQWRLQMPIDQSSTTRRLSTGWTFKKIAWRTQKQHKYIYICVVSFMQAVLFKPSCGYVLGF